MTELEFKLLRKIDILEIELKDIKKRYQTLYDNNRELVKVIGRIALHFDCMEEDRGKWTMSKDNKDNIIYKTLGITDCVGYPFLQQK